MTLGATPSTGIKTGTGIDGEKASLPNDGKAGRDSGAGPVRLRTGFCHKHCSKGLYGQIIDGQARVPKHSVTVMDENRQK
jgi:hypothetical protein